MAFTKDDFLPCVKEITCTLGLPVLRALDAVVQPAITEINTQHTQEPASNQCSCQAQEKIN